MHSLHDEYCHMGTRSFNPKQPARVHWSKWRIMSLDGRLVPDAETVAVFSYHTEDSLTHRCAYQLL